MVSVRYYASFLCIGLFSLHCFFNMLYVSLLFPCRRPAEQMFWEVMRLRREMTVAKLGFYLTDQG